MREKIKRLKNRWDRLTEGWLGTLIYIGLGFVIALGFNTILGICLSTDTPVVAVFSESMIPTFYKGDMIIVQGTQNVSIGDIIVFDVPAYNFPIIHRAINITDGKITTKGDHNLIQDPWFVDKSVIHGKAVMRIPLLGWVKITFFSLLGLA